VAGDFNLWGAGVGEPAPGWRPHGSWVATWPAAGRTRPHSQIDHVLVNDAVRCIDSEIVPGFGSTIGPFA